MICNRSPGAARALSRLISLMHLICETNSFHHCPPLGGKIAGTQSPILAFIIISRACGTKVSVIEAQIELAIGTKGRACAAQKDGRALIEFFFLFHLLSCSIRESSFEWKKVLINFIRSRGMEGLLKAPSIVAERREEKG